MRDLLSHLFLISLLCSFFWGCENTEKHSEDALMAYLKRQGITIENDSGQNGEKPLSSMISITVVKAQHLPNLDFGFGKSDPYVVLDYEGQREQSSVVQDSLNPEWGDSFVFPALLGGVLKLTVKDQDFMKSDETIGVTSILMPSLRVGETRLLELPLQQKKDALLVLELVGLP